MGTKRMRKSCRFELAGFFNEGAAKDINNFFGENVIGRELVISISNADQSKVAEMVFRNFEAKPLNPEILTFE